MIERDRTRRAESLRNRIVNELRRRGEDVTVGLQRYTVERFLYRLGRSKHRDRFVLKGATLLAAWGTVYRPTRDLDFTGYGDPEARNVIAAFQEICSEPDEVEDLAFDTGSITAEAIRDGSEYPGLRLKLEAKLGKARIPLQIDVGFGNDIVPGPEEIEYRTILGDPPPKVQAYPRESVIAEKLEAMLKLGEGNSRYKDFYDLHAMASNFTFERTTLTQAVKSTFERRGTPITDGLPVALSGPFYANASRAQQWRAYVSRNTLTGVPTDFTLVGELLINFARPIWNTLKLPQVPHGDWPAGGPWR